MSTPTPKRKKFSRTELDEFLDQCIEKMETQAATIEQLTAENERLKDRVENLKDDLSASVDNAHALARHGDALRAENERLKGQLSCVWDHNKIINEPCGNCGWKP